MLADNDRTALPGLNTLRNQKDAIGEHVGIDVQHNLVAAIGWRIVDESSPRIRRQGRRRQAADYLVPEIVAIGPAGLLPSLRARGICFRPELRAPRRRFAHEA